MCVWKGFEQNKKKEGRVRVFGHGKMTYNSNEIVFTCVRLAFQFFLSIQGLIDQSSLDSIISRRPYAVVVYVVCFLCHCVLDPSCNLMGYTKNKLVGWNNIVTITVNVGLNMEYL